MRHDLICGWLAAAAVLGLAGGALASTWTVTTTPGKEVIVARHTTNLRSGCAGAVPPIDISTAPAHGKVDVRPGRYVLKSAFAGVEDCVGHEVAGGLIWYTPAPGFTGTDTFTYSVHYSGKRSVTDTHTANVIVK